MPPIESSFNTNLTVQPSVRMIPRQMSQLTKKNNALISSKLKTTKNDITMDLKMEKFYKTED